MANHKSSLKRIRSNNSKRLANRYYAKTMRNALRDIKMITAKAEAEQQLPKVVSLIDKLAKKGIIHRNKAANLKSGLMKKINNLYFCFHNDVGNPASPRGRVSCYVCNHKFVEAGLAPPLQKILSVKSCGRAQNEENKKAWLNRRLVVLRLLHKYDTVFAMLDPFSNFRFLFPILNGNNQQ